MVHVAQLINLGKVRLANLTYNYEVTILNKTTLSEVLAQPTHITTTQGVEDVKQLVYQLTSPQQQRNLLPSIGYGLLVLALRRSAIDYLLDAEMFTDNRRSLLVGGEASTSPMLLSALAAGLHTSLRDAGRRVMRSARAFSVSST